MTIIIIFKRYVGCHPICSRRLPLHRSPEVPQRFDSSLIMKRQCMRSYFKHGQVQPCIFPARGISGISRVGVKWHAQGYVDVCVCVCVCVCVFVSPPPRRQHTEWTGVGHYVRLGDVGDGKCIIKGPLIPPQEWKNQQQVLFSTRNRTRRPRPATYPPPPNQVGSDSLSWLLRWQAANNHSDTLTDTMSQQTSQPPGGCIWYSLVPFVDSSWHPRQPPRAEQTIRTSPSRRFKKGAQKSTEGATPPVSTSTAWNISRGWSLSWTSRARSGRGRKISMPRALRRKNKSPWFPGLKLSFTGRSPRATVWAPCESPCSQESGRRPKWATRHMRLRLLVRTMVTWPLNFSRSRLMDIRWCRITLWSMVMRPRSRRLSSGATSALNAGSGPANGNVFCLLFCTWSFIRVYVCVELSESSECN